MVEAYRAAVRACGQTATLWDIYADGFNPLFTASEKLDEVKNRAGLGKSMIYRLIHEEKFPAPYTPYGGASVTWPRG